LLNKSIEFFAGKKKQTKKNLMTPNFLTVVVKIREEIKKKKINGMTEAHVESPLLKSSAYGPSVQHLN